MECSESTELEVCGKGICDEATIDFILGCCGIFARGESVEIGSEWLVTFSLH